LTLHCLGKRKAAQRAVTHSLDLAGNTPHPPSNADSGPVNEAFESTRQISTYSSSVLYIPSFLSVNGRIVPERYLYPLSQDHLLPLVEYNIYRASITNLRIVGHFHLISQACGFHGSTALFPYQNAGLPPTLKRTALQETVSYPDWIDLIPSPQMRDNAIKSQHLFTNKELSADLLSGLMGQGDRRGPSMLVWADPWDPSGWELTEDFIRKWSFLVHGCHDLFKSTNSWRRLRGERPLALNIQ
jgi:hypothetical protein